MKELPFKLVSSEPAEATCWFGNVRIEYKDEQHDVGVEVNTVNGDVTLFGESYESGKLDEISIGDLKDVLETTVLDSLQHGLELMEELEQEEN